VSLRQAQPQSGVWTTVILGAVLFVVGLVFVWRSFYAMRIPKEEPAAKKTVAAH
jgi:hypothetical protein